MIGLMDKGGQGTTQVPGQQQTPGAPMQGMGSGLSQLFAQNQPAVAQSAPAQLPQIAAPQYGPSLMPSPEQAMAATRARMLARTPIPAPQQAPVQRTQQYFDRGNGGGARGAASGGNGNGWGGR